VSTTFNDDALNDLNYWIFENKKVAGKICKLIDSIKRDGLMKGLGKSEKLKYEDSYSRRIDDANRLIYRIENGVLYISSCKGHYED